jgi:iron complex outermembrane receptor protein
MRNLKIQFALATAVCSAWAVPALAQDASQADDGIGANDIIVTARRSEERLQDVPVAVSVVSSAAMEAKGTFNPVDLVQSAPGLAVTATVSDRNNLT